MTFNITVNENKSVEYERIIFNQYENEIDQLEFVLPYEDFSYVAVFKSPKLKKVEIPIIDNKVVIDNRITSISGDWFLIIAGYKDDILFVSDEIKLKSCRNYLNIKSQEEVDSNIELLYKEIQETLSKLDDTGIDNISSVVEELATINSKIDKIPIYDYSHDLQEIRNLLTNANSITDAIL